MSETIANGLYSSEDNDAFILQTLKVYPSAIDTNVQGSINELDEVDAVLYIRKLADILPDRARDFMNDQNNTIDLMQQTGNGVDLMKIDSAVVNAALALVWLEEVIDYEIKCRNRKLDSPLK